MINESHKAQKDEIRHKNQWIIELEQENARMREALKDIRRWLSEEQAIGDAKVCMDVLNRATTALRGA